MSKLLRNLAAPAAIVLLTTACASGSANTPFESDGVRPDASLTVQVKNNNWSDAFAGVHEAGS